MKAIQYTIRGVAPEFDRRLRRRARESEGSFNAFLLQLLHQGMGESESPGHPFDNGLSAFSGTWVEDPETDRALDDQRRIDGELWQ